jgi:hypothetical protein
MTESEKIDKFFKREPIKYESKVGDVQVSLIIQQQAQSLWKRGIDYLCYADLTIEFLIGYNREANRNPSLNWKPAYLHVDSRIPVYFGGLFEKMHEYAENFSELLSRDTGKLSVHELRRAFDSIEDKFTKDFDNEEFIKHFVNPNP